MKTRSMALGLAAAGLLSLGAAHAQAASQGPFSVQVVGSSSPAARWGSDFPVQVSVTGPCLGSVTASAPLIATLATPPYDISFTGGAFPAVIPCTGGALSGGVAPLTLPWDRLPSGWSVFKATSTISPPGAAYTGPTVPLRFDPEFTFAMFGDDLHATLSTTTFAGNHNCSGRNLTLKDREALRLPMPPANVRTPYEMMVFTSGGCAVPPGQNIHQLLDLELPANFGQLWIYDNYYGAMQWRAPILCPPKTPCVFLGPAPTPSAAISYGRQVIAPVVGGTTSSFVIAAVAYPQANNRSEDLQDLWWSGPSESGWGLNIAKGSNDSLFLTAFIYDDTGKPTWVVMSDGQWDNTTNVWYGNLYRPHSAPYFSYGGNLLELRTPVGTGSLSFPTGQEAHFDYTIGEASGGKTLSRYEFGVRGTTPPPYYGIWWGGPAQDGWGMNIVQQGETIFATWYTYGADGEPTWYSMSAGRKVGEGHYSGTLYRTMGAQWAGEHYDGSKTQTTAVGTLDLVFSSGKTGTMTATLEGRTITNAIQRFDF